MNYQAIYDRIIDRGKERFLEEYTERHHIIPRCMGGTDDPENLVDLTPEEHYVCHQLLVKIHPNHPKLIHAVVCMSGFKHKRNKLYGWHKRRSMLPRKEQFIKQCEYCGTAMKMTEYYVGVKRWCSRSCRTSAGNTTKPCRQCGELFTSKNHKNRAYCSHDCLWLFKRENKLFKIS